MARLFAELFRVDSSLPPSFPVDPKYSRDPTLKGEDDDGLPSSANRASTTDTSSYLSSSRQRHPNRRSLEGDDGAAADAASSSASPSRRVIVHQLQPGDTIEGLCITYGIKADVLKRTNKLFSAGSLHMRKTINIPVEHCSATDAIIKNGSDMAIKDGGEVKKELKRLSTGDSSSARPRRRSTTKKDGDDEKEAKSEDGYQALFSKVDQDIVSAKQDLNQTPVRPGPSSSIRSPSHPDLYTLPDNLPQRAPSGTTLAFKSSSGRLVSRVLDAVNPDTWKEQATQRDYDEVTDSIFEL